MCVCVRGEGEGEKKHDSGMSNFTEGSAGRERFIAPTRDTEDLVS